MSKTVLITGCDRGIGLGLVKNFLKEGYKVCATCLNPDSATDLKQVLTDANAECKDPIKLDVRDEKSISQAFDEIKKCCPSLDILINNAGISTPNHPEDKALMITRNDMMHVYETDVVGALLVTKQFIPMLRDGNEKKIINISSNMGSLTLNAPNNPVGVWVGNTTSYRCAKAALNMATRNLAYELPEFVVVAMHPGWVDTEMGSSKGEVQAPLSVDESAQHLIATIARLTPEDSSGYKNYDGKDIPW